MTNPSLKDLNLLSKELNKITKLLAKERGITVLKRILLTNLWHVSQYILQIL